MRERPTPPLSGPLSEDDIARLKDAAKSPLPLLGKAPPIIGKPPEPVISFEDDGRRVVIALSDDTRITPDLLEGHGPFLSVAATLAVISLAVIDEMARRDRLEAERRAGGKS